MKVDGFILDGLTWMILIGWIPALFATLYLWSLWVGSGRQPSLWLLKVFAVIGTVATIASAYFGILAANRLLGNPPIAWAPPVSALMVIALDAIPIYAALRIYRSTHGGRLPSLLTKGDAKTQQRRRKDDYLK